MDTQADLATIDAYMRAAGVRAVAEACRGVGGDLELFESAPLDTPSPAEWRHITPVERAGPSRRVELHWTWLAVGVACTALLGLAVWWLAGAARAAVAAMSLPGLALAAVVVLGLLRLLTRSRPSVRQFSGTFEGRIH